MRVMINGLPGNMARLIAKTILGKTAYALVPFALTGPEINDKVVDVEGTEITLVKPEDRERLGQIKKEYPDMVIVDFSHPSAVNDNIDFYCRHKVNFICGTTGVDHAAAQSKVKDAGNIAVIAPNMGKQIVALLSMLQYAADNFPGAFAGYSLEIVESHQVGKADVSGTARAMIPHFNKLGLSAKDGDIKAVRNADEQRRMGIEEKYLPGHAWHTYSLKSADGSVEIGFKHNVNGRQIYADGVVDCLNYLQGKIAAGEKSKVYSMMDVLKGAL